MRPLLFLLAVAACVPPEISESEAWTGPLPPIPNEATARRPDGGYFTSYECIFRHAEWCCTPKTYPFNATGEATLKRCVRQVQHQTVVP